MESLIALILMSVVLWLVVQNRMHRMEMDMARLAERIAQLEYGSPESRPEPVSQASPPIAIPQALAEAPPADAAPPIPSASDNAVPAFSTAATPEVSTLSDRLRKYLGEEGWEFLVGGSLLNKIGALVLVIGLALFLAYSFTVLSPAGRAITCVASSWALLGAGILLERKQPYKVFARGLIGAGWAALYVTAYAVYAVPAARLIDNPYLGSVLLLIVAAGMIGHSILYRRQAITAVAYFAGFAALSVTPWSNLGFLVLFLLTASLLWIALRLNWNAMSLFGAIALYGSCIWRGSTDASLVASESLLLAYWLLFEGFDLLRVQRARTGGGIEYVWPINTAAFLMLSYLAWLTRNPAQLWMGCACAAMLFTASAVARWFLQPAHRQTGESSLAERMKAGSFELPIIVAAVLSGLAIALRAVGVWLGAGLAIEAEVFYLAGAALNSAVLRALGRIGFTVSLGRLLVNDVPSGEVLPGSLPHVHAWTPAALFEALIFYVNRAVRKPNAVMSSVAAALLAAMLWREIPAHFVGATWLALALVLFEIGLRRTAREFRFQAYALAAAGVTLDIVSHALESWQHPWIPLALGLGLVYALLWRVRLDGTLADAERNWFEIAVSGAIACLAMLCCWYLAPRDYRALALVALSFILLEVGKAGLPRALEYFSWAAAGIAAPLVIATQWDLSSRPAPLHAWITYAGATVIYYAFSERVRATPTMRMLASGVSTAFALCTLKLLVPAEFLGLSWSFLALVLFFSGMKRNLVWERWASYFVVACSLAAAVVLRFPWPSLGIAVAFYAAEFLSNDSSELEPHVRSFWSLAGTLALTSLLWQKFPGGLLTTAWGVEGVALLAVGFVCSERILRLTGLSLLLACILKLFLYDLRNLETGYRILSFIALGVMLLIVSSIYSRFRSQIRRHL